MSTLTEILAARDTAGARYVAAVAELRAAFVGLAGIERALVSRKIAYSAGIPGFGDEPFDVVSLRHSKYLPDLGGRWYDGIQAACNAVVDAYPTPDA